MKRESSQGLLEYGERKRIEDDIKIGEQKLKYVKGYTHLIEVQEKLPSSERRLRDF